MNEVIYGKRSSKAFETICPELQGVLLYIKNVLKIDHSILEGHRIEVVQNEYFYAKPQRSKLKWPDSAHNVIPSDAVDVVPFTRIPGLLNGIHWNAKSDKIRNSYLREMVRFASIFQMVAFLKFDIQTRWGGDWDKDWSLMDNVFNDYPHHEIVRS